MSKRLHPVPLLVTKFVPYRVEAISEEEWRGLSEPTVDPIIDPETPEIEDDE